MPSFVEIGPPVLEKNICEGYFSYMYMGVAAILVMRPELFACINTLVPVLDWPSDFKEEDLWNRWTSDVSAKKNYVAVT